MQSLFAESSETGIGKGKATPPSVYKLSVRDSTTFRRLLRRWKGREDVAYAHANYTYRVHSTDRDPPSNPVLASNNPRADSLDHLPVVRAFDAWNVTTGGSDVTIGVIDTGFYLDHPDLRGQFWINDAEDANGNGRFDPYSASEGGDLNGEDDDGNGFVDDVIGYDFVDRASPLELGDFEQRDPDPSADLEATRRSGHGSSVAAVAAAAPGDPEEGIAGVAPGTRLVALRALAGDGVGESDDIAAAIVYGATIGIDVLNLSFGRNRGAPVIEEAIQYASDQGTVVVGSAGNTLTDDPHYPSDYPDVISVVWLAEDGQGVPQFNRSQFGIGVDIGAPGTNVYTADFPASIINEGTTPSSDDLYRSVNGSSFSAPQIAGAAALLRSADSTLSPASIRNILTTTASDLNRENWDHTTGAGLVDASQALARSYPAQTEIIQPDHDDGTASSDSIPIVGTALDPSFRHYAVYYAEGTTDLDERRDPWIELAAPTATQTFRDTLARWPVSSLDEGEYTLRIVTTLRSGRTVEDRRRVIVDRSAPELQVDFLGAGRVEGENGIIGDVVTDDVTRLTTTIQMSGETATVQSELRVRRHGVAWPDESGTGGTADVRIEAENASGLTTTLDTTIQVPSNQENTSLLRRTETSVPRGYFLSEATDFDRDGLPEIVLNQSRQGGLSDSVRSFEWQGDGFAPADTLIATLFPKDVADTNDNGLQELLLQVGAGTLLLEQRSSQAFPDQLIFADTTDTDEEPLLNGTRLTDLDGDGQGEILATTGRRWELLEWSGDQYETVAQLENPTTTTGRDSSLQNAFDEPAAETGDFDADGRRDLLVGDRDGDLIVYESTGNDEVEVAWTHETDRVDAGNRFAVGDLVGDERQEFVTMTTYFPSTVGEGEREPPISYYTVWRSSGEDEYERVYRLPVAGPYVDYGSLTAADLDGDGREEVVVAHAPTLMVLDRHPQEGWRVLYEHREAPPIQSRTLVTADFSGDGYASLVAETAGEHLTRFVVDQEALSVPPPVWTRAQPAGASSVNLTWRAPGADSVTVFAAPPSGSFDPVRTTTDSSAVIQGSAERRFTLRAWQDGTSSPLSSIRQLRPHLPAVVESVSYPESRSAKLRFSEPLASSTQAKQFHFGDEGLSPNTLIPSDDGKALVLRFPDRVAGQSGSLQWTSVVDATGLSVDQNEISVSFPIGSNNSLFIESADILSQRRVRLTFNEPLAEAPATDPDRYQIRPRGRVESVDRSADAPKTVTLTLDGLVIGATGAESSVTVTEMVSAQGNRLVEEGRTVRLTSSADDLSNVYVYPNPYRARQHGDQVTIAGLPTEASIRIFSPDGRLVRALSVEANRDGGVRWDLRDRRGEQVPAGIYLFRVNAPDHAPVLEKAAVIR